ncbi:fatty acid desaturase-domain-containing protein, partial [Talaromyces proteolyticus]
VYDLTEFQKIHPGGISRLRMSAGRDVTVLLETTHDHSVLEVLRRYRVGSLRVAEHPIFNQPNEFALTLRRRVKEHFKTTGQDPKYSPDILIRCLVPIFGIGGCYYLLYWNSTVRLSTIKTLITMVVWSWSYFAFTTYWVHDASHASLTHNPRVWDAMGTVYNFVMGFSDIVWFHRHVLGHHPYTNVQGVDPDISVEPFSITRFLPSQKWSPIYSIQHIYAPILYSLLTHFSKLQDILACLRQSTDMIPINPLSRSQLFVFWAGKVFFFTYRCLLPIIFSPSSTARVISTFLFSEIMLSWIAAFVFESNHVVGDVLWVQPPKEGNFTIDWVQMQIETAQDYGHGSWITTFLTGSLNYQVVHHVFPQINQKYYPEIADIVRSTCREFGIKYRVRDSFFQALGDHLLLLKRMGLDKKP